MITLATLQEATAREVFDQVKDHLLKQGKVSKGHGGCLYQHEDLKCAAGCLISPEEYRGTWERTAWEDLVAEEEVPAAHADLILELQVIHDENPPELWADSLQDLADNEGW